MRHPLWRLPVIIVHTHDNILCRHHVVQRVPLRPDVKFRRLLRLPAVRHVFYEMRRRLAAIIENLPRDARQRLILVLDTLP